MGSSTAVKVKVKVKVGRHTVREEITTPVPMGEKMGKTKNEYREWVLTQKKLRGPPISDPHISILFPYLLFP
jgi:hypothetical protein